MVVVPLCTTVTILLLAKGIDRTLNKQEKWKNAILKSLLIIRTNQR
jgi:hypothetical protein